MCLTTHMHNPKGYVYSIQLYCGIVCDTNLSLSKDVVTRNAELGGLQPMTTPGMTILQ